MFGIKKHIQTVDMSVSTCQLKCLTYFFDQSDSLFFFKFYFMKTTSFGFLIITVPIN